MSVEANRQSIVTAVLAAKATWAAYVLNIEFENFGAIDLASQVDPYLMLDIVYVSGDQLDLGTNPLVADYGSIALAAGVKEGGGTAGLTTLVDHFRSVLQLRDDLGAVRTKAGKIQKGFSNPANGFYYLPLLIPFWTIS